MRLLMRVCFVLSIASPFSVYSDSQFTQRKEVQNFIHSMVKEHHFNAKQLYRTMSQVVIQPQIIERMDKPYEKKTWDVYSTLFLTQQRVQAGLTFWIANQQTLDRAAKQYGVPAEIIVAILGVETLYGEHQGEFKVLDALSTLAFYYPKRAPFFTKELKEYLLLCREQGVDANHYLGSYAGAIGLPQFMPSSYRYYAVDFNHTGKRDLVGDNADVIGSVANYFYKHGWKMNQAVVQQAQVSGYGYKNISRNPRLANYRYWQLRRAGIKPLNASYSHPNTAGLIELVTNKGNEYWLAYPNFFVITRYNSSPQYALVVYLLSQQLKMQWTQRNSKRYDSL